MAANTAQGFQSSEADQSPEIQSDVAPAKEEIYWYTLLHKAREAAYQHIERYVDSQHAHIQTSDTDPLIQDHSVYGLEGLPPVPTEEEVRTSLQDLQDLLPQIKASAMISIIVVLFLAFCFAMLTLCIWFATPLHKSKSQWASSIWLPTEVLVTEAGWEFCQWVLVGRCIANAAFVRRKLDEGQLRSRDKYRLRGWVWRLVGYVHRGKS